MITTQDKELLAKKGITEAQIAEQLACFQTGFPYLKLDAAASIEKGILAPDAEDQKAYLAAWDAYKNTELLLSQYTKVMFRIEKNLVDIDYEMYAEEGKHLKEMLYDLVDFDATAEKRRIQEKLLNNDMNLCLLEIMRDSLIALRDYPKNGQLYYRLLKYRYFEAGNTNEDVMMMLDDMPSTTYYRNRKKAIRLYATMLWAFTRPEKIQNKMEEINWKKSGSKVAVN